MRIDNLSGFFDVREYNAKKSVQERQIKSADQTITFQVSFDPDRLPRQLAAHAKSIQRRDGNGSYMLVKFKIGAKAKWFAKVDGKVTEIARPANEDLDGKRFDVCVDYRELNGDPAKQEACGYWANGLLISEAASNMFADLNDEQETPEQHTPAQSWNGVQPTQQQNIAENENDQQLPF